MSTTCQNVIDRAKAFNPLNATLTSDATEMLTRIQQLQQRIFTAVASLPVSVLGRCRFTTSESLTSTGGASSRSINLASATQPVERLLRVSLSGSEVSPVLEFDVFAQLPPRYFQRARVVYEVDDDWANTAGALSVQILYIFGPAAISVSGATSQAVTVPDEWVDVLILPLAMYLHLKDPGRDPQEYQRLDTLYSEAWNRFLSYATNYPGELNLAAMLPPPPKAERD